ncbi:MAG: hypothetical protein K2M50_10270 [Treponemataceae bacterium]|nr:hypothetical protein [Treponemataceae bacterium]
MKKLLLSAIAAMSFLIGFASCAGDLHDVPDPNKMEGNWWYYELDTSAATSDTINLIFNSGDYQTKDITGVKKTGKVFYLWAAATKSDDTIESLRSDNPTMDLGDDKDKLGVFVFSNAELVNLYAWDAAETKLAGGWPGKRMLKPGEAAPTTVVATISIKATGVIPGTTYWFSGLSWDAGWPYAQWNGDPAFATDDDHAKYRATADESGIAQWSGPFIKEIDVGVPASIEFKFIDIINDNLNSGQPSFNPDNIKVDIPEISNDTSLNLVITCSSDDGSVNYEDAEFEPAN